MHGQPESPTQRVMETIEAERRRDDRLRRIAKAAWTVTFAMLLILVGLTTLQIVNMLPILRMQAGGGPLVTAIAGLAMPLVFVLGTLSVLIATLCTVGLFLRMRAASLQEIQLRLAALEEMLTRDGASPGAR